MTFAAWLTIGLFVLTYLGMAAGGIRGLRIDRSWIACCAAVDAQAASAACASTAAGSPVALRCCCCSAAH
jgi:hypothetical protein